MGGVSIETMKMWLTEKGISLIILIISITIMSIIGAGIVSFMGAKQKSYPYQIQSYQALNLANAGVEFAIRYAYDNKNGFNLNPGNYIPSASPGKIVEPFGAGQGTFELIYSTASNGTITSIGTYGLSKRTVRVTDFRNYANL